MVARLVLTILLAATACGLFAAEPSAHELRPAIVTVRIAPDQQVEVVISANLEALIAQIGPKHKDTNQSPQADRYNQLRALPPSKLRQRFEAFLPRWLSGIALEFNGGRARLRVTRIEIPPLGDVALARISKVTLTSAVPPGARTVQWSYGADYGSSVLRLYRPGDDKPVTAWLKDGTPSEAYALQGSIEVSSLAIFADYIVIGFTHIVPKGLDHILFVLGLYLLSTQMRPLLVQVTAFTLAHTITLGLGLYGVVRISPAIVEPLIAASIVYVAVENVWTSKLSFWRPVVVFGFGLLHGLGFAGVLREIGLARSEYVSGLIGFNVGVELGQLTVITMAFLATGLWFASRPWYRRRIVVPASLAIAAVGLYWTVERVI